MKRKFILEFDEAPALVFVQKDSKGIIEIYQDGQLLKGVRSIIIEASAGEVTTHAVEYITGRTD